ncbi:MAG: YlxR family protein [Acidimicrobiales bacterium]
MGCRRVAPADELVRVVAGPGGTLATGRGLPGRGAWLCAASPSCVEAADKRRAFSRSLRTDITADATAALRECLAGRGRMEEEPAGL